MQQTITYSAPTSSRALALAAVATAVVTWGCSAVVIKLVSTTGVVASVYRLWFALPVLWAAALLWPQVRRGLNLRWLVASLVGGVLFAGHQVFFFSALKQTSVANVAIIGALQPALVIFVAGPLFGERVGLRSAGWALLAVAGAAMVVLGAAGTPSWSRQGDLLAVVNLVVFTAYFLASKHFRNHIDAPTYVVGMTSVAALLMLAVATASGEVLTSPHGWDWALLLFLALVPGSLGHLLSNWAHPHLPAFLVSVMLLGVPVIAAGAAAVFLDEPIHPLQIGGGALVLASIGTLVTRQPSGSAEALAESVVETETP